MPRKSANAPYAPLPSTLERSEKKAQDTYEKTLESAENQYKDDARAHRAAWGAVKHSFEKIGDHWEAKDNRGPSDPRSADGGAHPRGKSYGGVDINGHSRAELMQKAEELGLQMGKHSTKGDLAEAIDDENQRLTRAARNNER